MRFLNPWVSVSCAILLMNGCASMQSLDALADGHTVATVQHTQVGAKRSANENEWLEIYERYEGTPYQYGGMSKNGFDCSGFIHTAFREAVGVTTPRTTEQLAIAGSPVRRDQLQPGDVIIFRTSVKQLHAGIYTGDAQFIHASTSKGVTLSSLDNQYWQTRYVKARRLN